MFQIFKGEYEYQLLGNSSLKTKNQAQIPLLTVSR